MSLADVTSSPQGCPACNAVDAASFAPAQPPLTDPERLKRIELSLPGIHCANCIIGVERALASDPAVAAARVNLTLKRVSITAEDSPGQAAHLTDVLRMAGFDARPLDSAALEATRQDATGRALLARIGVAGFALMNVMLLSISVWSGATDSTRDLMHWISAAVALPAVAFAAQPFFANAWRALRAGRLDMDVPISTAILLAAGMSLWETTRSGAHAFFDAALMLTFFLLIGRYLAHITRASARSAAAEIAALEVRTALRATEDGAQESVPIDALRIGDVVAVTPGGRIPADGMVIEGHSETDCSMLTGETMPEPAAPGTLLRAGMMNLTGALKLRVEALGEETLLAEIARLVETAEQSRGKAATLAGAASRWYSHVVNALAVTALLGWGILGGDWHLAINIACAVLIITCPCALGLAVPAVLTAVSGRLFRQGILLKDGEAFERLAQIDTVVIDKTGTLTTGIPVLNNAQDIPEQEFRIAASLANVSAHPLSQAIAAAYRRTDQSPAPLEQIEELPGQGTQAIWKGQKVRLGRAEWVGALPSQTRMSATYLRIGDAAPVAFHFDQSLRAGMDATIAALRDSGLEVHLLSGDAQAPTAALAERLSIPHYAAGATPVDKVAYLEDLKTAGRKVLMVGDGLNDAAALAAAHVSISPGSAVDACRSAADMIVLGDDLHKISAAYKLAGQARRRILENFAFAFAYNIVTVPVAYAGYVTPLIAAIAMSGSSIAVSLNALRIGLPEYARGRRSGTASRDTQ